MGGSTWSAGDHGWRAECRPEAGGLCLQPSDCNQMGPHTTHSGLLRWADGGLTTDLLFNTSLTLYPPSPLLFVFKKIKV